jgi:hypothetical protein
MPKLAQKNRAATTARIPAFVKRPLITIDPERNVVDISCLHLALWRNMRQV